MYGAPALKIRGKLVACIASHKSAEAGSLVVRIDFEQREELVAAEPDTYYLTDHYVGYPAVLVRLSRIRADALADLLRSAWRFVSDRDLKRVRAAEGLIAGSSREGQPADLSTLQLRLPSLQQPQAIRSLRGIRRAGQRLLALLQLRGRAAPITPGLENRGLGP